MRIFHYFLFENFDPNQVRDHPGNPRRILSAPADALLSRVADFPPRACPSPLLREEFGSESVDRLIAAGALREEGGRLCFDTPVFLAEDAPALRRFAHEASAPLADRLWERREALWEIAGAVSSGFDPTVNLYFMLCGMVFDGLLFDRLSRRGSLAVSRPHASGLDYLSVIYEDCSSLQAFSDGLLCSYNRLTDGRTSLESFGDADGDRFDFYRCFRLRERGPLPERWEEAGKLLDQLPGGEERAFLLAHTRALLAGEACDGRCLRLLELFGYVRDGKICVPVFREEDTQSVLRLGALVEETIGSGLVRALLPEESTPDITAIRHGAAPLEVANELYHILFGGINESLAARGLVAAPPRLPGEGRYRKCIQC